MDLSIKRIIKVLEGLPNLLRGFREGFTIKTSIVVEHEIVSPAIGIAVGFATFENVCYLTENGAADFSYVLIRGVSAGSLHLLCGIALGCGIAYVFRKKWIMVTGTIGALGACVVFHGIYNILITANSRWNLIGYLFPIFLIFALLVVKKFRLYRKIEFE